MNVPPFMLRWDSKNKASEKEGVRLKVGEST